MNLIYLPKKLNVLLINTNYLYIYNSNFFFSMQLKNNIYYFNPTLKILKVKNYTNITSNLTNFFFSWDNFFFSKLYFIVKGFKIKKINNNLQFNFNHAHNIYWNNLRSITKKIQKNKILLISKNLTHIKKNNNSITNIKFISKYTKRGLRTTKTIVLKKKL